MTASFASSLTLTVSGGASNLGNIGRGRSPRTSQCFLSGKHLTRRTVPFVAYQPNFQRRKVVANTYQLSIDKGLHRPGNFYPKVLIKKCYTPMCLSNISAATLTEIVISPKQYFCFIAAGILILVGGLLGKNFIDNIVKKIAANDDDDDDEDDDDDDDDDEYEYEPSDIDSNTSFKDVKGVDEAKTELEEIVHYLQNPKKFTRLGGRLPKGVLLVGPPGTGKTMLARAIASEAKVPFFASSGGEFDEEYVGVGAKRLRCIFNAAKKKSPCIIFIDEIDAIGGQRRSNHQYRETINQLLVELDGFKQNDGIIVLAATNFPELLDTALVRAGRFDRQVVIPMPDVKGRREILESYMSKVVAAYGVNLGVVARGTTGFSPADLANLVNIAAVKAAVDGSKQVSMADLEHATDRIIMGSERKSEVKSEELRKLTAFHESGHALVAIHADGALPIHKATIVSRGTALGMVTQLGDNDDEMRITRRQMLAELEVCMGGRAAEELIFGENEVTSGASSDIQQATSLAIDMVTKYGMSLKIGIVFHDYEEGRSTLSAETRSLIENEVKELLEKAYKNAKNILTTHHEELHAVAKALLKHETLSGSQIKKLIKKRQKKSRKHDLVNSLPSSNNTLESI